ncbi:MAG: leucine-rich repeat domain-containing protein [Erysipelotrichaceae bacterium]|nr:leucine-rich repeat domain-containing protein [Erysipelotrichaceae bacterium]
MQEFIYKMNDNETYTVMAYRGDEEVVKIEETYAGKPVTILFDSLFKGHKEIKEVIIPDSIEDIGGFIFDGCDGIEEIKLPAGLKNLWQYAFVRTNITEIEIPEGVSTIPPFAFKDCIHLKKVVCHTGLKKIHDHAFEGCKEIETFIVDPGTYIGDLAFEEAAAIGIQKLIVSDSSNDEVEK